MKFIIQAVSGSGGHYAYYGLFDTETDAQEWGGHWLEATFTVQPINIIGNGETA